MKTFPSDRIHYQDGKWFHNLIVFMDRLELLPAPLLLILAPAMAAPALLVWPAQRLPAYAVIAAALFAEAAVIRWGTVTRRWPSPLAGPLTVFAVGHAAAALVPPLVFSNPFYALGLHVILQGGLLAAMVYGSAVEPYRVGFREEAVKLGDGGGEHLKIILISDLHLDRRGKREDAVLDAVRKFNPDLILWPGDITNLSYVNDPVTLTETKEFIAELCGHAPVYLSRGTPEVDDPEWVREIHRGTDAVLLDHSSEVLSLKGVSLFLAGIPSDAKREDYARGLRELLAGADGSPVILLHHIPDLVKEAVEMEVDLYVAGHTHGGQIRLPLFGALFTASIYGDLFSGGSYRLGKTNLVVSRGVGMEGAGAPRLRFLCPPEVVGIRLETAAAAKE